MTGETARYLVQYLGGREKAIPSEYIPSLMSVLKKQIPENIKEYRNDRTIWKCPECDFEVFYTAKYCPFCGQKLLW